MRFMKLFEFQGLVPRQLFAEIKKTDRPSKKRQRKSILDPKLWKKNESKRRRLMGEMYTGYRRVNNKKTRIIQDTPKQERKMGPTCQS